MQESFEIKTSSGSYPVIVGEGLLKDLKIQENHLFIIDSYFENKLNLDGQIVISIPAQETSKNLNFLPEVIAQMRSKNVNRGTHVYVIGGGIMQDIATFVTSIYMRGIDWSYFPTTLLSMADSCIGGKSSINVAGFKNLVGNIYPPNAVYIDLDFCKTLAAPEIIGGLVEAVKICFAKEPRPSENDDLDQFDQYLKLNAKFPLTNLVGIQVVIQALRTKKWFIEVDEFDKKERLLLNYGHTFGHALEASSQYAIAHGPAVAIGILAANSFTQTIPGKTKFQSLHLRIDQLNKYLLQLLEPIQIPLLRALEKVNLEDVLMKFANDKKHLHNEYRVVIPLENGYLKLVNVAKDQLHQELILNAYKIAIDQIKNNH